jgi:response regulator of citrate/malate metabolism
MKQTRIVIIDDDLIFTSVTSLLMKRISCELDVVIYNDSSIAVVDEKNKEADIYLIDIYMPGKNGWDVVTELDLINSKKPVYIISSSVDKRDKVKAEVDLGITEFVTKPLSSNKLKSIIPNYSRK